MDTGEAPAADIPAAAQAAAQLGCSKCRRAGEGAVLGPSADGARGGRRQGPPAGVCLPSAAGADAHPASPLPSTEPQVLCRRLRPLPQPPLPPARPGAARRAGSAGQAAAARSAAAGIDRAQRRATHQATPAGERRGGGRRRRSSSRSRRLGRWGGVIGEPAAAPPLPGPSRGGARRRLGRGGTGGADGRAAHVGGARGGGRPCTRRASRPSRPSSRCRGQRWAAPGGRAPALAAAPCQAAQGGGGRPGGGAGAGAARQTGSLAQWRGRPGSRCSAGAVPPCIAGGAAACSRRAGAGGAATSGGAGGRPGASGRFARVDGAG